MIHAVYIGSLQHLKGQGALIEVDLPEPEVISHANADYVPEVMEKPGPIMVKAQFDNTWLTRSGKRFPMEASLEYEPHARFPTKEYRLPKRLPEDALGYGWHLFPASDFKVEKG